MIVLPTGRPGRMLALGLTLLVLGVLWLGVVQPIATWFLERGELLAQQQALALRMERLAATLPALRREGASGASAAPVALLEGETDAVAAANLQERVQALAATAGATISSVEMLSPERADGTDAERAVRLRLSLEATWPVLLRLLDTVEAGPPLMLVDDLQLEATRLVVRPVVSPLQARLTVIGFRAAATAAAAR